MTSAELRSAIDASGETVHFQHLYQDLLYGGFSGQSLQWLSGSPCLLLIAILSDTICVQRALMPGYANNQSKSSNSKSYFPTTSLLQNSPPALSPASEYLRMTECINDFLDKWEQRFATREGHPYIALFYFCRLYVDCPYISHLPGLVGYPPNQPYNIPPYTVSLFEIAITDRAVDFAWAIVEHIGAGEGRQRNVTNLWEPLIVFLAALVVWAKEQQTPRLGGLDHRRKQLLAFKLELDKMSWRCSADMASCIAQILQPS